MIHYKEPLFRPPSEADSLIIQATLGCSYNRCTFCAMYKSKPFKERQFTEIAEEIENMSAYSDTRRVFIADGDALVLETGLLLKVLKKLKDTFPRLRRISIYANTQNIRKKSDDELDSLSRAGLSLVYLGFESGSDVVLEIVKKGVSMEDQRLAVSRIKSMGIEVSAMIITGLGGVELWKEHIEKSAELVNLTSPKYLSTLSLMLVPECSDRFLSAFKESFTQQNDRGMLEEEKLLISLIDTENRIIFKSNHASNALPLSGILPRDRERLIEQIDCALEGGPGIRPLWMRGL